METMGGTSAFFSARAVLLGFFAAFSFLVVLFISPAYVHAGECDDQYSQCVAQRIPDSICVQRWRSCLTQKCATPSIGAGTCNQDQECQTYCTESGTSKGGLQNCCDGGPKERPGVPNQCKDKVDGKCNPKKEDGKGGKPPPLPKPKPKPKGPPSPEETCKSNPNLKKDDPKCEDEKKNSVADFLKDSVDKTLDFGKSLLGFGDEEESAAAEAVFDPPSEDNLDAPPKTVVENVTEDAADTPDITGALPDAAESEGLSPFQSHTPPSERADPSLSGGRNVLGDRTIARGSTFPQPNERAAEAAQEGFAEAESRGVFDGFLDAARGAANRVINFFLGRSQNESPDNVPIDTAGIRG